MALNQISIGLIEGIIGKGVKTILSLGYPDIQGNFAWDGGDPYKSFASMGCELYCLDYTKAHPPKRTDIVADLNEPQNFGQFDLVIDPGTLEHCMNIGQALRNVAQATKVGGYVLHISPITMINHGYFNLCPVLFIDWYRFNGWEIERMEYRDQTGIGEPLKRSDGERCSFPMETVMYCVVKKTSDKPMSWKIQGKYRAI